MCPKCEYVNEKEAKFCGGCGYNFFAAGPGAAGIEMVDVPGRGYVPKGTMIEPGHATKPIWVTGLVMWLVIGPGLMILGLAGEETPFIIAGGTISSGGLIIFLIGLAVKTAPVYASRMPEYDDALARVARTRESPGLEGFALKIEVPVLSF